MPAFDVSLTMTQARVVRVDVADRVQAVRAALEDNLGFAAESVQRVEPGDRGPTWLIACECERFGAPIFEGEEAYASEDSSLCAKCCGEVGP